MTAFIEGFCISEVVITSEYVEFKARPKNMPEGWVVEHTTYWVSHEMFEDMIGGRGATWRESPDANNNPIRYTTPEEN